MAYQPGFAVADKYSGGTLVRPTAILDDRGAIVVPLLTFDRIRTFGP